jgi:hypothetical protein
MAREMTSIEQYRSLLAGATSEDELLLAAEARLTLGGWRWHHIRRSDEAVQQGDPGWPDIVGVRGPVLLVRELKAEKGRYEPGQREWLEAIAGVTRVDVGTWRPRDMAELEETLKR